MDANAAVASALAQDTESLETPEIHFFFVDGFER